MGLHDAADLACCEALDSNHLQEVLHIYICMYIHTKKPCRDTRKSCTMLKSNETTCGALRQRTYYKTATDSKTSMFVHPGTALKHFSPVRDLDSMACHVARMHTARLAPASWHASTPHANAARAAQAGLRAWWSSRGRVARPAADRGAKQSTHRTHAELVWHLPPPLSRQGHLLRNSSGPQVYSPMEDLAYNAARFTSQPGKPAAGGEHGDLASRRLENNSVP